MEKSFSQFSRWLDEYGDHLWTLALFPNWNKDDVAHEFQDIALAIRKKFLQEAGFDGHEALLYFWEHWNKRNKLSSQRKQNAALLVPLMLFGFGWSIGKVSKVTGWGLSHIRFVALESLRNLQKNPVLILSLTRDCLRTDLFIVEYLLGESWNDAFQVFGPKQLKDHLSHCGRCHKQWEALKDSSQLFKQVRLERLPEHIRNSLSHIKIPSTQSEFLGFRYRMLGFFPRLTLQATLVAGVLFLLINMPFIGDLRWSRWRDLGQRADGPWTWTRTQFQNLSSGSQNLYVAMRDKIAALRPSEKSVIEVPPTTAGETAVANNTPAPASPDSVPVSTSLAIPPAPTETVGPAKTPVAMNESPSPAPAAPTKAAESPGESVAVANKKSPSGRKIFLRWGAFTSDLDGFTPKILAILSRYQAEKAGDLELGAEYRGGRYFHFRIPEEHRDLLMKELEGLRMNNFYVDTAPSTRDEIPGKIRIVFLVRSPKK